jgi:stage V sporulation protein D (sporulation-specific penicillin-binding protein)
MKIKPYYNQEDEQSMESQMVAAPDVTNISFSQAKEILKSLSLNYQVASSAAVGEDFTVVDQYPKAGAKMAKNGTVCLYNK